MVWHQRDLVIIEGQWGDPLFRGHPLLIQLSVINQSQLKETLNAYNYRCHRYVRRSSSA